MLQNSCKIGLFVLITIATSVHAQTIGNSYTLQQCIDIALNNNINVKQRELTMQSNRADFFQSKMAVLPNINASVTNNYNTGFSINPITNATLRDVTFRNNNFGLNGSMTLFNGLQTTNNIRLQKSNTNAAQLDVSAAKNNIALQVANAFMQVLMNKEIALARNLQMQATKEQLNRQKQLYDLGGLNKVRYLQIKAQYANEESQLVVAQAQLEQAYLNLWQLMNITPDTANNIISPIKANTPIEQTTLSAEQIYNEFISKSPEAMAAKARANSAQIAQTIAQGGRSPRLTLSGGFNSFFTTQNTRGVGNGSPQLRQIGFDSLGIPVYTPFVQFSRTEVVPFNEQFDRNLGKSLGFTLSLPILNGWQVNTNIQKQRINKMSADLSKKQVELDVYKNVYQAYLDFKSAQKRFEANQTNYEANKEAYEVAQAQFDLGALNTADYLNTKNQFLQAETNLLQARYELIFRKKVIDFYSGKPLY